MPGYVIHLAVGEKYLETHKVANEDAFLKGLIAPDLSDKAYSHYGECSSKPNFDSFLKDNSLDDSYTQGYFLHLIVDYFFYKEYLEKYSPEIYNDYDKLNEYLIKKYHVDVPNNIKDVVKFKNGKTKILNKEKICQFIDEMAKIDVMTFQAHNHE